MKAKELAEILLKYPEKEVVLADDILNGEGVVLSKNMIVEDGVFALHDEEDGVDCMHSSVGEMSDLDIKFWQSMGYADGSNSIVLYSRNLDI